jgi:branched-chain amino acid transport system substrate-binding protein
VGLTRLGKFTLTVVVLVLAAYWLRTNPDALQGFRLPELPPRPPRVEATPRAVRTPRAVERTPQGLPTPLPRLDVKPPNDQPRTDLSARDIGREQYEAGNYAGAIANLSRAITVNPLDIQSIALRENAYALLPGKPIWQIVVVGPFSGAQEQYGLQILFGVYYAQRVANQAGGIGGRRIVVRFFDDKANAEEAVRVAQQIVRDNEVLALVGHYNSRATLAAGPVYQSTGLPAITSTSTNPAIANLGDYIFRVVGHDGEQAKALANAIWGEGHRTTLVFSDDEDAYSRGLAENFQRLYEQRGGRIIKSAFTVNGEIQIKVDPRDAQAVLVAGEYADAGKIARMLRELGSSAPILGGDAVYSQGLFASGGDAVRGVRATAFYHYTVRNSPLLPRAEEFARAFEAAMRAPANQNMATSYDAISLIFNAMRDGAATRQGIQAYLASVGRSRPAYIGVTGRIAFDSNGEAVGKPWVLVRARQQDFVADKVVAP